MPLNFKDKVFDKLENNKILPNLTKNNSVDQSIPILSKGLTNYGIIQEESILKTIYILNNLLDEYKIIHQKGIAKYGITNQLGTKPAMIELLKESINSKGLHFLQNSNFRDKSDLSTLKKILREEKYIDFINNHGKLPDREGLMILRDTKESLIETLDIVKSGLRKEKIIDEIDLGLLGYKNTIKESLSSNINPIYTIGLGFGNENYSIGEIAFRLDTSKQSDNIESIMKNGGIIDGNIIINKFQFRKLLFEKFVNLNHPIYRMIQDINMYQNITDGQAEINYKFLR